jgi:putative peptidoglycan lipid II flippase
MRPQRQRTIAHTAALLLPVQVVFRAAEASMPVLLATSFGRGEATDLLYLLSAYFAFAGSLVTGAFQDSVLVPIVTDVRRKGAVALQAVTSSLLGHVLLGAAALACVLGAIACFGAYLAAPRPLLGVAVGLVAFFALGVVAAGVRSLLVALLNAHGSYVAHPVSIGAGFALALGIIALGRDRLGVVVVPLALAIGELLTIGLLWRLLRAASELSLVPNLARPEAASRFFRLVWSDVAGATITRINPVIDQLVASTAGVVGGGTILRYAMEVGGVPTSLLQATVLPVLLGHLSWEAGESSDAFGKTVRTTIATTCALLAGLSGAMLVGRTALLRLLFLHGRMDAAAVDAMADVLPAALAGSVPFGALLVLARSHVALQNTRIMLPLGALNAGLNVVLDLALVRVAGLPGIALATSLVHAVVAVVFYRALAGRLAAA